MALTLILLENTDGVAVVTLNRPAARNALSSALLTDLRKVLRSCEADETIGCIVLTGADPAFCAGLDLNELRSGQGQFRPAPGGGPWSPLTTPVVGAINGPAVTGGFELALACDIRIASERATFVDTHVDVGISPGWGLTVRLSAAIGLARALEASLSGQSITAAEALTLGLVTHVLPHDELLPFTMALARTIASKDRRMVRELLATYRRVDGAAPADRLRAERVSRT